jgi:queuosine precursor transporter
MTATTTKAQDDCQVHRPISTYVFAGLYVAAAAAANLAIAHFGPRAVPLVSFLLVGFVMTTRDRLHDAWQGRNLSLRLGLLIAAGSAVSYAVNADAAAIAVASAVAFAASETINGLVYQPLLARGVPWVRRVNIGNLPNALTDSVLFVSLAFGFAPSIIALQVLAKTAGGLGWSLILSRRRPRADQ